MTVLPRQDVDRAAWDAFVAKTSGGWVWHLSSWLSYLAAAGRRDESYALADASGLTALTPALLPVPDDDPLPAPIGMPEQRMIWPTRGQPQREATASGFPTRVVDLSLPHDALWTGLRRSSHALIHRAEDAFTVRVADNLDGLYILYKERADLPQINNAQWHQLGTLRRAGILRVYEARDVMGDLVGATGVMLYKQWAYYASGRTVAGHGVSHLLQWHIIKALKAEGWPFYEVGWHARPEDDEKARQIAFFKQGFGGEDWWVPVFGTAVRLADPVLNELPTTRM